MCIPIATEENKKIRQSTQNKRVKSEIPWTNLSSFISRNNATKRKVREGINFRETFQIHAPYKYERSYGK